MSQKTTSTQSVKELYRSETDRMVAGVCGGLAEFFGIESSLVRIGFILIILFAGSGLLAYLILWLLLPTKSHAKPSGQPLWGLFLVGIGIVTLLHNLGWTDYIHLNKLWPVLLIFLGLSILTKK